MINVEVNELTGGGNICFSPDNHLGNHCRTHVADLVVQPSRRLIVADHDRNPQHCLAFDHSLDSASQDHRTHLVDHHSQQDLDHLSSH